MADVLAEVRAERERQDARWGWRNRDSAWHAVVLMEEVGEFARALHDERFADGGDAARRKARAEAIHVAAVAVAFVEGLDAGRWLGGKALGLDIGEKHVAQANERSGEVRPLDVKDGRELGLLAELGR